MVCSVVAHRHPRIGGEKVAIQLALGHREGRRGHLCGELPCVGEDPTRKVVGGTTALKSPISYPSSAVKDALSWRAGCRRPDVSPTIFGSSQESPNSAGSPEPAVRRGEAGTRGGETQVAPAHQRKTEPHGRAVHHSDDRFVDAEVVDQPRRRTPAGAPTRPRGVIWQAVVVSASLGVAGERVGVGTSTKATPLARHDYHPDGGVAHRQALSAAR